MLTAEQIAASHEAQLAALHTLHGQTLKAMEKLASWHVQTFQSTLEGQAQHAQVLLNTASFDQWMNWPRAALHPLAQKAASYSRDWFQMAVGLGYGFSQLAESRMAASQRHLLSAVETAMAQVPNGAESIENVMEGMLSEPAAKAVAPMRRRKAA